MFYRNELSGTNICYSLYDCTKFTLGYGIRGGGGYGDYMVPTLGSRYTVDVMFFFSMQVILLNLIAGVIITTFGQLREEKDAKELDTSEFCFMCGIEKQTFDRASKEPDGFKRHIKIDHNMWNYTFFIFHLWEQDKDDDDGLEQYIRRAIDANDITWFPMNKALCLDQDTDADEQLLLSLQKRIADAESAFSSSVEALQADVVTVLEQLTLAVQKDSHDESKSAMTPFTPGGDSQSIDNLNSIPFQNSFASSRSMFASNRPLCLGVVDVAISALKEASNVKIACTIVSSAGNSTVISKPLVNGIGDFGLDELFLICSDAAPDDIRTCRIQFFTIPASKNEMDNEAKFFASVDICYDELVAADGTVIEHVFNRPDVSEAPCCVRLITTSIPQIS